LLPKSKAVSFLIRTQLYPLDVAINSPEKAADLAMALKEIAASEKGDIGIILCEKDYI